MTALIISIPIFVVCFVGGIWAVERIDRMTLKPDQSPRSLRWSFAVLCGILAIPEVVYWACRLLPPAVAAGLFAGCWALFVFSLVTRMGNLIDSFVMALLMAVILSTVVSAVTTAMAHRARIEAERSRSGSLPVEPISAPDEVVPAVAPQ